MEHRETKTKGQTRSDNVKHGIFPDLVGVESVMKGLVMESMHVPISVTNTTGSETKFVNVPVYVKLKLVEANLNLSRPMHMVTKEHAGNGPTKTKTKPTWTRQARMDCGLKNTICAATKPTLGKRTTPCDKVVAVLGTESREKKRSKTQNDAKNNETVGVLEHPGRTQ